MILEWWAPWWAMPLLGFGVYATIRFALAYLITRMEKR